MRAMRAVRISERRALLQRKKQRVCAEVCLACSRDEENNGK